MGEQADEPEESFTAEYAYVAVAGIMIRRLSDCVLTRRQRREHRVFRTLLQTVPGLEERLIEGSDDEAVVIAEMVRLSITSL
jgi:hypothetical protein